MLDWRERLKSALSQDELQPILDDYFRRRFRDEGATGALLIKSDWYETDGGSPFHGLCLEIGQTVRKQYEFCAFTITVIGSRRNESVVFGHASLIAGLHIEFRNSGIYIELESQSPIVQLHYSWPELYSNTERGEGGSHTSKTYTFDLNAPDSIENLTATVLRRCDDMLRGGKQRPSD